jgi:hypothetical protein
MASVVRVEILGDTLAVVMDDGTRYMAYPTPHNVWLIGKAIPVQPPDPGNGGNVVGPIPDSLRATATDGTVWNLTHQELVRAGEILTAALAIDGMTRPALVIMLITALVESHIQVYTNIQHYPETINYPNDGVDAGDADSVGIFQQRPSIPWGTPRQCMDPADSTRRFIGGPNGPNHGNPPGLFDISGWAGMEAGAAAQAVQGSQFPGRYSVVVPVANAILAALLPVTGSGSSGTWRWPFKYSQYVLDTPLAQYGMRYNPGNINTGVYRLHAGLDFGAGGIAGMDIPCASDGTVSSVGPLDARGNNVSVVHAGGLQTDYFHMRDTPSVVVGQKVKMGDKLGVVGSTGNVTGPHLHWQTRVNGETMNPRDFMKARGVPES